MVYWCAQILQFGRWAGERITAFTIRHNKRARPCKRSYDADAGHARYLERHPPPEPQTALPEAA
jgi:hypothetical protein